MKKPVRIIIAVVAVAIGAFMGFFWGDYQNTHSSQWHEVSTSEMSITIPKSMKEGKSFYTSTGQTSVAVYENSKAAVSVSKIPYSVNANLENMDLKKYINSISMNGKKLVAVSINDGYYATYTQRGDAKDGEEDQLFAIEAFFSGDDALYSVKVTCMNKDRDKYEESMMEWIKSFELK